MKCVKMVLSSLFLSVFLIGCTSTVKPKQAIAAVASMDGNEQNSGEIANLPDGSTIVTPHWHDRYCSMQATYGTRFNPPLSFDYGIKPYTNGTFVATGDAVVKMHKMNHWRKNPTIP